jgi:DHA1 family bicyclomycin/chloramphenicol resistance-like MFS transporter
MSSPALPRYLIFFIGALVAIGPLSLDAYLPAMPAMAESFGVNIVRINNTISIYLVGYGLGQFLGGAFSDQLGRKRIGTIGLSIFALASVAIGFAHSVEQMQWLRFVQAIGGGFSTVICMAIVRDVYPVEELGKRMAMVTLIMLASPVVAPSIGAFLLRFGWPTIFYFKASYATVLLIVYRLAIPETRPGHWSQLSIRNTLLQAKAVVTRKVGGYRIPILYALTMALSASVFMTFLTNSSFAYIEYFGVSETLFPLYFGASILGLMATNIFSMRRLTSGRSATFFKIGVIGQAVGVATLLTLVLLGAQSIWFVVLPITIIVASFGFTGPSGSSRYMSHFDKLAGSASSVYTTLMFGSGAIFGALSGVFFDGSLRPMAITMFCCSAAACTLLVVLSRRESRSRAQIGHP